jgi:ADP-heptose:LPS heptosyltransferase
LIHPGASAPSRRYPPEGFAKAADLLTRDYGLRVIFSGSESERALVAGIRERMAESSDSLAGDLAIADFSALVRRAPVLISNNTGPVHIAAALGTPVVDLYAQTNPQHTPWGVRCRVLFHEVPCKYCYKSICPEEHHDCLRRVSPESVATAAWELLSERDHDGRESGVRVQESGI